MKKIAEKIIEEIRKRYKVLSVEISKQASGKGQILLECNHGDCERIGQYAFRCHGEDVETYFPCHIFRKGRLSIYLKK